GGKAHRGAGAPDPGPGGGGSRAAEGLCGRQRGRGERGVNGTPSGGGAPDSGWTAGGTRGVAGGASGGPAAPSGGDADVGESVVPPQAWELIGRQIGPGKPLTVCANDVVRFFRTIGEDNPIFFDEKAARQSVYGGRPMPLTFPLTRFESGD